MFIFFAKKSEDWEGIYYVEEKPEHNTPDLVTKDETNPHPPYNLVPKGDLHDALNYVVDKAVLGEKSLACGDYIISVMPPDLPWSKYKIIISET